MAFVPGEADLWPNLTGTETLHLLGRVHRPVEQTYREGLIELSTAPDPIRTELRSLSVFNLFERASAYRTGAKRDVVSLTKLSLRMLARRAITLEEEISELDAILKLFVKETAPELVATLGTGTDAASTLFVAAGDDRGRLRNEAAFAHLCGASPLDASSGKNQRHRLNRSGDRHGELCPLAHRAHPDGLRPSNHRVHRSTQEEEGADQKGDGPMPQAICRPRGVQPPTSRQPWA